MYDLMKCDHSGRQPGSGDYLDDVCELTLEELQTSRRTTKDNNGAVTYEFHFICMGTMSERMVRCRVEDPDIGIYKAWRNNSAYGGMRLITYSLDHLGGGVWHVVSTCGTGARNQGASHDVGPPSALSFTTSGSSVTIKEAIFQQELSGDNPNIGNAINVANDDVTGATVLDPTFRFSEVWSFPWNEIFVDGVADIPGTHPLEVRNWLDAWRYCVGKVNVGAFRNWEAQEVLLRSVNGRDLGDWQMEVTFEFEARESRDVQIPSTVAGGGGTQSVKGWEYLWYSYTKLPVGGVNPRLMMQPNFGWIARIYHVVDFAMLGIGQVDDCFYVRPSDGVSLKPLAPCAINPTDTTGQGDDWEVNNERVGDYDEEKCTPAPP